MEYSQELKDKAAAAGMTVEAYLEAHPEEKPADAPAMEAPAA